MLTLDKNLFYFFACLDSINLSNIEKYFVLYYSFLRHYFVTNGIIGNLFRVTDFDFNSYAYSTIVTALWYQLVPVIEVTFQGCAAPCTHKHTSALISNVLPNIYNEKRSSLCAWLFYPMNAVIAIAYSCRGVFSPYSMVVLFISSTNE